MAADSYLAYADGACRGNPGPGGWGVVIVDPDGGHREFNGRAPSTTNNRMELTAAIEALRQVPRGARVVLRSDSQYLVKTINEGWKRNANRDLWDSLDAEKVQRQVEFQWVRGHSTDELNNAADRLANLAIDGAFVNGAPGSRSDQFAKMLRPGESLARCQGCGGQFVAQADEADYCSLAACQLKARSRDR